VILMKKKRWKLLILIVLFISSCGVRGIYYSETIQDHPDIINRVDSERDNTYRTQFHKIEFKKSGRLHYHKLKLSSCSMDTDTTLNALGNWRRSGDTIFLNFPTYFENHWHGYLISHNRDTLIPLRSKEVARYIKR
jgi:hypothetical protein